jgi:L-cystine uptake protein TcyP (sodium:dicarboxylate symporter family)
MMTFVRERLLIILVIVFISAFLGVGILSVDRKNTQVHSDCEEYQDSIYLLNYKVTQLEMKVGSLLLRLEEIEGVNQEDLSEETY